MTLRDVRQWLAVMLGELARKVQPQPVEVPRLRVVPPALCPDCVQGRTHQCPLRGSGVAVCPDCKHSRGRHRVVTGGGRGKCLAPECDCTAYAGPWPVHHVHVTTEVCPLDNRPGGHWGVQLADGTLLTVPSWRNLPGETP